MNHMNHIGVTINERMDHWFQWYTNRGAQEICLQIWKQFERGWSWCQSWVETINLSKFYVFKSRIEKVHDNGDSSIRHPLVVVSCSASRALYRMCFAAFISKRFLGISEAHGFHHVTLYNVLYTNQIRRSELHSWPENALPLSRMSAPPLPAHWTPMMDGCYSCTHVVYGFNIIVAWGPRGFNMISSSRMIESHFIDSEMTEDSI